MFQPLCHENRDRKSLKSMILTSPKKFAELQEKADRKATEGKKAEALTTKKQKAH